MSIKEYHRKRNFNETPEPSGEESTQLGWGAQRFVIHKHRATRLHFDLRLELDGVYKSFALPKGPSQNPLDQHLAVRVEDHPLAYGSFEGIIPKGNYGAGTVMIWDEGTYIERSSKSREDSEARIREGFLTGKITVILSGHKVRGEFALVRLKDQSSEWLMLKKKDAWATYKPEPFDDRSVKTKRTMAEIADQSAAKGEVWLPNIGPASDEALKPFTLPPTPKPRPKKVKAQPRVSSSSSDYESDHPYQQQAVTELFPSTLKPMLPQQSKQAFYEDHYVYEIWPAGTRALIFKSKSRCYLLSRGALRLEKKFAFVEQALKHSAQEFVMDAVINAEKESIQPLDLLHLDGENLRTQPLKSRLKKLDDLNKIIDSDLMAIPHRIKAEVATSIDGEVLAREQMSTYVSGVSTYWQRFKAAPEIHTASARLTSKSKVLFRDDGFTKEHLFDYYDKVSDYLLPHLKDRPLSLLRFPQGIEAQGFFHKDLTGYLPEYLQTFRVSSHASERSLTYALAQNKDSLLYLTNLCTIEFNPWFDVIHNLDSPTYCVIDLDPHGHSMSLLLEIARTIKSLLDAIQTKAFCKTSGSTGLHIFIPLNVPTSFEDSRKLSLAICQRIHDMFKQQTSLERNPSKRRGKIYLDYMQNRKSATMVAPYSVRPRPKAPVSCPLSWQEVEDHTHLDLEPSMFNIQSMPDRLAEHGDLMKGMLTIKQDPIDLLARLLQIQ